MLAKHNAGEIRHYAKLISVTPAKLSAWFKAGYNVRHYTDDQNIEYIVFYKKRKKV